MKIRQGYVSNSSSSSFIISSKKKIESIKVEVEFSGLEEIRNLEKFYEYKMRNDDLTREEVDDYYKDELIKMKKAFENGETVYIGEVSSDDTENVASMSIYNDGVPKSKDYTVIQEGN
jgi:ribosomal 30S subunit maturation factor RimM